MVNGRFTHYQLGPGRNSWHEFIFFILSIGLSLALYSNPSVMPLSVLPILAFAGLILIPRLGVKADQVIFFGFFLLCFIVDDTGFAPWNEVETWTEVLGQLLFRSLGLTGFEVFCTAFALFILFTRSQTEKREWRKLGLLTLMLISCSLFIPAIAGVLIGMLSGGSLVTALIQVRFFYLLPILSFIGFVIMRDKSYIEKIFRWLTILTVFKSIQAIFVYLTHRSEFLESEYVYEHYFSAYAVIAMIYLIWKVIKQPQFILKLLCLFSFGLILPIYILDDRRTSYVGLAFAAISVLLLLPKSWYRVYGRLIFAAVLLFGSFTAITWSLPAPYGFIGALYRSFGQETGNEGPSYRDLENANLFRAVAQSPLTGIGFGKEFEEVYPMPSVAAVYPRYKIIPHNNLFYTWSYGGPLCVAGLSLLLVAMLAISGRLICDEDKKDLRLFGVIGVFFAVQYVCFVFGDLGLQVSRNQLLAGLILGGSYRLIRQKAEVA